jgi:hypothetical protein
MTPSGTGRVGRNGRGLAPTRRARAAGAITAILVLGVVLAACAPRQPALIEDLAALPGVATDIEVTFLDNPDFDQVDWWEIGYTTADPAATVHAVRDVFISMGRGPIDDANTGHGFTIPDAVEVREIFTTDEATTRILVRIRSEVVDGYRHIDG